MDDKPIKVQVKRVKTEENGLDSLPVFHDTDGLLTDNNPFFDSFWEGLYSMIPFKNF